MCAHVCRRFELAELLKMMEVKVTRKQLRGLMAQVDSDRSGFIEFNECVSSRPLRCDDERVAQYHSQTAGGSGIPPFVYEKSTPLRCA